MAEEEETRWVVCDSGFQSIVSGAQLLLLRKLVRIQAFRPRQLSYTQIEPTT